MAVAPTKKPANKSQSALTPLGVISLFVSLTEVTMGFAAVKTTGNVQICLTVFSVAFPVLVACAFFCVLWRKAFVFYPPSEYVGIDIDTIQTLLSTQSGSPVTKTSDIKGDVKIFGNPDHFQLLFKANTKTWERSTKAMAVAGGCLVQVSSKVLSSQGHWNVAEALTFVPGATIAPEASGEGAYLTPHAGDPAA